MSGLLSKEVTPSKLMTLQYKCLTNEV